MRKLFIALAASLLITIGSAVRIEHLQARSLDENRGENSQERRQDGVHERLRAQQPPRRERKDEEDHTFEEGEHEDKPHRRAQQPPRRERKEEEDHTFEEGEHEDKPHKENKNPKPQALAQ